MVIFCMLQCIYSHINICILEDMAYDVLDFGPL